jgi:ABC-type uncharacterized transport system permease subunit
MRKELQRIEPRSVLKVAFFLGLVVCFIAALLYGVILKEAGQTDSLLHEGGNRFGEMTWAEVWISAFVIALAGAIFYAIAGGFVAMIYNLIARHFGGVEMQIADKHEAGDLSDRPGSPTRI